MQRQTTFFLPFLDQVVRRYMEPHSPQTNLSDKAYLLQYFPSTLLGNLLFAISAGQFKLGIQEVLTGNDGRVVICYVVLGEFPVVFLLFLG